MLTLLSVLAVMWGGHSPTTEVQPRSATTTSIAPNLPEWRATPQPAPAVPMPSAPPPEPLHWVSVRVKAETTLQFSEAPRTQADLTWWGRRQTDGG